MGQNISEVRKEAEKADVKDKQEMQQRLQILEKMVNGRLENKSMEILSGERGDQEIHAGTIVKTHNQINITQSSRESQKLSDAIGDFFDSKWMGGLEKMVQLAFEAVLGNEAMGEYEMTDMMIVWSTNALLRCDAYYYRWNFVSKGVINEAEGVVGIILVKRVIDVTKVDPQVLTWAISEQASKQGSSADEASEMIDSAMKTLEKVVQFQAKMKQVEIGSGVGKSSE